MVKFITRQHVKDTLNFFYGMRFDSIAQNLEAFYPFTSLRLKLKGNDDYRDVSEEDLNMDSVKKAILSVFGDEDVMVMVLKNDKTKRIAFVFNKMFRDMEGFEKTFACALKKENIEFIKGWLEEVKDFVFILQL